MEMLVMRHWNVIPEFALCGYDIDYDHVRRLINQRRPDILFVCLGSPAQELFISKMRGTSGKTLFIGLGGSADIYSGEKRRSPYAFRALGKLFNKAGYTVQAYSFSFASSLQNDGVVCGPARK
jgi:exopolysaccharide biosynthesis WecB/TagA/CpsF family protein